MKLDKLFELQNVIGHAEDDDKVSVFVTKKLTMKSIQARIKKGTFELKDIIPDSIVFPKLFGLLEKRKKTKVIEIGEVKAHIDRGKYRPLQPGCEIGLKGGKYVGTLGMFVKVSFFRNLYLIGPWYSFINLLEKFGLKSIDDRVMILTNSHVANNIVSIPEQLEITQPGATTRNSSIIGKTIYSYPIEFSEINDLDASLIELKPAQGESEIIKVGEIEGIDNVHVDENVHKYGRTTGYTKGKCVSKYVTLNVNYPNDNVNILFRGLDMYTNMSSPGDSGSVIVRESDNKVVSLLFAGSDTHTFGIPMKLVQKKLHFNLLFT